MSDTTPIQSILAGPDLAGRTLYVRAPGAATRWMAFDLLPGGIPVNPRPATVPAAELNWRTLSAA